MRFCRQEFYASSVHMGHSRADDVLSATVGESESAPASRVIWERIGRDDLCWARNGQAQSSWMGHSKLGIPFLNRSRREVHGIRGWEFWSITCRDLAGAKTVYTRSGTVLDSLNIARLLVFLCSFKP